MALSILVSLGSGQWDMVFGGGNLPAFVVGAVAALASGLVALAFLPSPGVPDQGNPKADQV
ncbi:general substrate transporter [Asimina triloba]